MVIAAATACASAEPASVLTAAGESATEVPTSPAAPSSAAARETKGDPVPGAPRTTSPREPRAATVDRGPVRERGDAKVLPPAPPAAPAPWGGPSRPASDPAYPDGTFAYPDDRVMIYPDHTFPYAPGVDGAGVGGIGTGYAWGAFGHPDGRIPWRDGGNPYGHGNRYRDRYENGYGDGYADGAGAGYGDDYADGAYGYEPSGDYADGVPGTYRNGSSDGASGGDGNGSSASVSGSGNGSSGSASGGSGGSPLPLGGSDSSSVIHPATGAGTGTGVTGTGVTGTGVTGTGVTGTGVTGTGAGQSTTGPEWGAPILVEDFNGTRIDESKWGVYDSPNARTNPRTSRATSVAGGMLRMTGGIYGGKDLSGGVASTLLQQYGRWEVRLRTEAGAGYSAVALLMPEDVTPSNYAEVDFVEVGDIPRQLSGVFVHGSDGQRAAGSMRADFTQWHTAAVDWLPDRLTFWLDGKMVWNYTGPLVPRNRTMGLALQNDVICDGALCRNASTPATVTMYVDWVRVYRAPR